MIKMYTKNSQQLNQQGISAIMLAMFISIVMSLLAVGFATLVRKDQSATLDKTLSYQAQYAAEAGVNRVTSYIDSTVNPGIRANCTDVQPVSVPSAFKIGQADVTCAVWTKNILGPVVLSPSQQESKFASFKLGSGGNYKINISWESGSYGNRASDCSLPSLGDSTKIVLGVSIAPAGDYSGLKRFYLVPSQASGCGSQKFTDNSGSVFNAKVNGTMASIDIHGFSAGDYVINVNPINGSGSKKVTIDKANTGTTTFTNTSQYKIDVNAKAQDITKRVVVYYNPAGTPGKPYVVNIQDGGTICKDYQVNGNGNNTTVSDNKSPACPAP